MENLSCGTQYSFHMRAYNRIGEGLPSHTVTAKTNGAGMVIYLLISYAVKIKGLLLHTVSMKANFKQK